MPVSKGSEVKNEWEDTLAKFENPYSLAQRKNKDFYLPGEPKSEGIGGDNWEVLGKRL